MAAGQRGQRPLLQEVRNDLSPPYLRGTALRFTANTTAAQEEKHAHFPPRARNIIFLFMHGGVSHVDTFDPKPKLDQMDGRPLPFKQPLQFSSNVRNLLRSPWRFRRYGDSGLPAPLHPADLAGRTGNLDIGPKNVGLSPTPRAIHRERDLTEATEQLEGLGHDLESTI